MSDNSQSVDDIFERLRGEHESPERIMLKGGFSCFLKAAEGNQWHEFCYGHEVYKRYLSAMAEVEIGLASLANPKMTEDLPGKIHSTKMKIHELEWQLYEVGKAWYAQHRAASAPAPGAQSGTEGAGKA